MEDGGGLAYMAAKLAYCHANLVAVHRISGMGALDSHTLRSYAYVRMQPIIRTLIYFCSVSTSFGGCAAKIHATSFSCSSW
jgi:hypothetical protein